jgi:hypothetical protein
MTNSSSRERSGGIRAWAKDQGTAVSDRGRIPASVLEQDEAATKRILKRPALVSPLPTTARAEKLTRICLIWR